MITVELDRVLASQVFRSSRRCQSLLRTITEHSIAGDVDSLKERALGVEVFGRPVDYDTSQDPIVRASAAEVRKKLAQYYVEIGHESETRIELPLGSYVAEFQFDLEKRSATPLAPPPPPLPPTDRRRHRQRLTVAVCAALASVLIVTAVLT